MPALHPSYVGQQEDDGEHRVQHDHHEDRFDHRTRGELADAFGAALHLEALEAANGGDDEAEYRRLDHAGVEMPGAHRVAQPVEELYEGEVEIDRAGDRSAKQ